MESCFNFLCSAYPSLASDERTLHSFERTLLISQYTFAVLVDSGEYKGVDDRVDLCELSEGLLNVLLLFSLWHTLGLYWSSLCGVFGEGAHTPSPYAHTLPHKSLLFVLFLLLFLFGRERVQELGPFNTMLALRGAPVKPIWDTELNYGLAGLGEGVRRIDDATGAAYIAQSYIQSIQYGIDTTFWYLWTGTRGYYDLLGVQLDPSTPISNGAWNNLRALLEGTRMTRCVESGNIFMCQFVDRLGEPFTLMWTREGTSVVNVKGLGSSVCGLEVADSRFNRACSVVRGDTITIGMLPVQVTNRLN